MAKICPQCNHIVTGLTSLALIPNCSPPMPGDNNCSKCGTKLEEELEPVPPTCPDCDTLRRMKNISTIGNVYLIQNLSYVQFCTNCGHDFSFQF